MMECSHDILDVEPSDDRNPHQSHRLSAPVPRRRRLRPVAHRRPMAERLPVSRLRPRSRVGVEDQEAQLRVHPLPSSSFGHRRHPAAPNQAVARDLVPGRLSDGHSLQWHLRPAAAEAARDRVLSQCLDARRQASPRHGHPERSPLSGLVEIDEASLPQRDKGAPPGPGRSPEGKIPIAGAVELGDGDTPGRLRLATIRSCSAKDLGSFVVRNTAATATIKTDGWRGCSAVPRDRHQPHVVGDRPAHEVLAWIHTAFCNLKGWARGVCHGLRAKRLQTCLDEFVFRFNRRRNRHAAFLSLFLQALRAKPHPCHILIKPEPNA